MERRTFLLAGAALAAAPSLPAVAVPSQRKALPFLLYGPPVVTTDLRAWFEAMQQWGVTRWMAYPYLFHNRRDAYHGAIPFVGDDIPAFRRYLKSHPPVEQEKILREQERLCATHGMDFWYMLPFPLFPAHDKKDAMEAMPELFTNGRLKISHPALPELMKKQVRSLKRTLPKLKGINIWFAEGAGTLAEIGAEELKTVEEWLPGLLRAFADVTKECGLEGIVFAHNYLLTVAMRTRVYDVLALYPHMTVMEDITWPQEDAQHPFLGYLTARQRRMLFRNPVATNFLLDTEYIGQGILPSVYPRWWKKNIDASIDAGVALGMGRVFFWDGGYTDVNFNRLNAHVYCRLCNDPNADLHAVFTEAVREMFGVEVSPELIELLWQTEPVIKEALGIHGIVSLDHTRFLPPVLLDRCYAGNRTPMSAVNDLFEAPGTKLYPQLTGELNNLKQWRWQTQTVAKPASVYLAAKNRALRWLDDAILRVDKLSVDLRPQHRELLRNGYRLLRAYTEGLKLVIEVADAHARWAHRRTLKTKDAVVVFRAKAREFRELANEKIPENPLMLRERLLDWAEFLEKIGDGPFMCAES
ncbi:MAG: hypothetical protein JSS87_01145 [Acidobacteria bacterium]|nr:hypothetical protein [Acidobacteriota bacterium]